MSSSLLSLSGQVDPSELIPEDWTCNQLGSTCEVFGGGKLGFTKERHYQGSGVTAFSAAGPDGFVEKAEITDRDGVVLSAIGANCGRCFFASGNWTTLANVQAIIPKNGLDARYLFYFVNRVGYWDRSGSAQPFIKPSSVHASWVAYPKAEAEQSKIAEVLSTVDRAIEQSEALIAKQQRIKTGLMQDLLTRGIDEHGNIRSEQTHEFKDSRLGRIPIEWEVRSMSELTIQIVDGVHHTPTYTSSGVPFIVVSDLTAGIGIDFNHTRFVSKAAHAEYAKRVEPRSGDVLVSKDGTLGVARLVPDGAPRFSIFVSVALLRPKHRLCIADLLWSFFESGEFYRQLGALSAGTGLAHIHLEHFRKFQLRCPRVDEQGRIFAVITAQSRLLTEYTDALQKLRSVRTALMQDLLTGKRRVTPLLEQCEGVTT